MLRCRNKEINKGNSKTISPADWPALLIPQHRHFPTHPFPSSVPSEWSSLNVHFMFALSDRGLCVDVVGFRSGTLELIYTKLNPPEVYSRRPNRLSRLYCLRRTSKQHFGFYRRRAPLPPALRPSPRDCITAGRFHSAPERRGDRRGRTRWRSVIWLLCAQRKYWI